MILSFIVLRRFRFLSKGSFLYIFIQYIIDILQVLTSDYQKFRILENFEFSPMDIRLGWAFNYKKKRHTVLGKIFL